MVVRHLITHGLFFAVIFNGYLLLVMALTSPRVWGYTDYPDLERVLPDAAASEAER